jgi:hypothetical protein
MIEVFVPRGPWGQEVYPTPAELAKLDKEAGKPWPPDKVLRLPAFPTGRPHPYPFWRPTIRSGPSAGRPRPFMRAGGPLDLKSGVYLIYDGRDRVIYVGSSWGTSKQGNLRRTMARHWQSWHREELSPYVTKLRGRGLPVIKSPSATRGGVTFARRDIFVCAIPLDNDDPRVSLRFPGSGHNELATRQLEAWLAEKISEVRHVVGSNQLARIERDDPDRSFEEPTPF